MIQKVSQCCRCESQFRPGVAVCPDCGGQMEEIEVEVEPTLGVRTGRGLRLLLAFLLPAAIVTVTELTQMTRMSGDVPWQVAPVFAGMICAALYLFYDSVRGS